MKHIKTLMFLLFNVSSTLVGCEKSKTKLCFDEEYYYISINVKGQSSFYRFSSDGFGFAWVHLEESTFFVRAFAYRVGGDLIQTAGLYNGEGPAARSVSYSDLKIQDELKGQMKSLLDKSSFSELNDYRLFGRIGNRSIFGDNDLITYDLAKYLGYMY